MKIKGYDTGHAVFYVESAWDSYQERSNNLDWLVWTISLTFQIILIFCNSPINVITFN